MSEQEKIKELRYGRIKYEKGQKMHNVVFLEEVQSKNDRRAKFLCSCGKEFEAWIHSVKSNVTKSCGCYRSKYMRDKKTKHGLSRHPMYNVYNNMIERCYTESCTSYNRYDGVGVRVCDEWRHSFESFYEWAIKNGWREGLQLDKDIIGNGKLYSPENCCFVTPKQNSNKRKTSRIIEYDGVSRTISGWADCLGIKIGTLWMRLNMGWTMDRIINTPIINRGQCR